MLQHFGVKNIKFIPRMYAKLHLYENVSNKQRRTVSTDTAI